MATLMQALRQAFRSFRDRPAFAVTVILVLTVPALLALVAVAAVLIPAYRASRVEPLVALRHD